MWVIRLFLSQPLWKRSVLQWRKKTSKEPEETFPKTRKLNPKPTKWWSSVVSLLDGNDYAVFQSKTLTQLLFSSERVRLWNSSQLCSPTLIWPCRDFASIILTAPRGANRALLVMLLPVWTKREGEPWLCLLNPGFKRSPGTILDVNDCPSWRLEAWSWIRGFLASQLDEFDVFEMKQKLGGIKDRRWEKSGYLHWTPLVLWFCVAFPPPVGEL